MSSELIVYVVAIFVFLAVWAAGGLALGLLARRKNRRALAWGVIGGFPAFILYAAIGLSLMPFLCPRCKGAMTNRQWKDGDCPKCGPSAGSEPAEGQARPAPVEAGSAPVGVRALNGFGWRWPVLGALIVVLVLSYIWSTGRVRQSVVGLCDSVAVGDPVKGIEERARAAGLYVVASPAGIDASGRPREAHIHALGSSIFFYVYNCWIHQKDGKVTSKYAAGGAL